MQRHIFFVLTDGGVLISCTAPFLLWCYFWCQWSPMIRAISAHCKLCHDECPSWRKTVGPVDGGKVVPKIGEGFPIVWPNDQCRVELWDRKGQRKFVLLRQVLVVSGKASQLGPAACRNNVASDGIKRDPVGRWVKTQTHVPWCAGGRAFRFFKTWDLSLKSVGFCCEMSISALATMSPTEGRKKTGKCEGNLPKAYYNDVVKGPVRKKWSIVKHGTRSS